MKKKIFIIMLLFLLSGSAAHAAHYVHDYSSVDENEIRWGGSTTYSARLDSAISLWNGLGKVNITPDTIWTYQDLAIADVNRNDVAWRGVAARYVYHLIGTDTLKFNMYYMGDLTDDERENAALHELGHSLGLAHSFFGNILYDHVTSQTTLGDQDISDYRYLWGY